eukprot:COSAG02_NODE_38637_length_427_cov_0.618902_1_plen_60_part_01
MQREEIATIYLPVNVKHHAGAEHPATTADHYGAVLVRQVTVRPPNAAATLRDFAWTRADT